MSIAELLAQRNGGKDDSLIAGVAVGIVTNIEDPDKKGRVKIRYPWRDKDEQGESDWVRICSFMAGKDRGSVFIPEVDDEVLVAFEQGNINMPYIIGGLWNDEDATPEGNADGKNNIRLIKSRSGHKIVFDDNAEEKKEKVEILTNSGHGIALDDTDKAGKIELKTKAGHIIVLDDKDGSEKIEIKDKTGNNLITIDSKENKITVKSDKDIEFKCPGGKFSIDASDFEVKTSASVKVEAGAGMDLNASGQLTAKGATINLN